MGGCLILFAVGPCSLRQCHLDIAITGRGKVIIEVEALRERAVVPSNVIVVLLSLSIELDYLSADVITYDFTVSRRWAPVA